MNRVKSLELIIIILISFSSINAQNNVFPSTGNVGIGTVVPNAKLHIGGSNQEVRFDYAESNSYYGSLRWAGLQLGNNGGNRIVAGRTSQGGGLDFYVNNTNDGADYSVVPDGILAMKLSPNGNVGIGTNLPQVRLHIGVDVLNNTPNHSPNMSADLFASNGIVVSEGKSISYSNSYESHGYSRYDYNGSYSTEGRMVHFGYYGLSFATRQGLGLIIKGNDNNVGIGTADPTEKLSVNGNIRAKKLIISQQNWSDYVFNKGYKLRSLSEVNNFLKANQHLPDIPSASEVLENGINVGDMQALLLKKIEELTLYVIQLNKNIELQKIINNRQATVIRRILHENKKRK